MQRWLAVLALALTTPLGATELHFLGQEYPPYNWSQDGRVQGGMVDVLRAACDKLHYRCTFTIVPLARAMQMLERGETSAVMSLIPNDERANYAVFSPPIVVDHLAYFGVRGGAPKVPRLQALEGWTVAGVRGSNSLHTARQNQRQVPGLTVVEEVNNETLVRKLRAGRYGDPSAIIGAEAVLRFEAQKVALDLAPVLTLDTQRFVTAFSPAKVDAATREALFATLNAMKKSGAMRELLLPYGLTAAP